MILSHDCLRSDESYECYILRSRIRVRMIIKSTHQTTWNQSSGPNDAIKPARRISATSRYRLSLRFPYFLTDQNAIRNHTCSHNKPIEYTHGGMGEPDSLSRVPSFDKRSSTKVFGIS